MLGRTHTVIGLLIGFLIIESVEASFTGKVAIVVLALAGVVLPDVDIGTSMLGKRLKMFSWFVKHRGFFHTPIFLLLSVILLTPFLTTMQLIAFSAGMVSHLLLDGMTPKGIPLLTERIRMKGMVKTDGVFENVFFLVALGIVIYFILV